jgi:hypothetical protein
MKWEKYTQTDQISWVVIPSDAWRRVHKHELGSVLYIRFTSHYIKMSCTWGTASHMGMFHIATHFYSTLKNQAKFFHLKKIQVVYCKEIHFHINDHYLENNTFYRQTLSDTVCAYTFYVTMTFIRYTFRFTHYNYIHIYMYISKRNFQYRCNLTRKIEIVCALQLIAWERPAILLQIWHAHTLEPQRSFSSEFRSVLGSRPVEDDFEAHKLWTIAKLFQDHSCLFR